MYDNPFTYGRPIEEPERLYGRDLALNQILSRLRNVAFESTSIVGERRSGKTSVLKVLMHQKVRQDASLDDSYIFAFLDCSVVGTDADEQMVWAYLLQQVAFYLPDTLQDSFLTALEKPLTNLQLMMIFTQFKRAGIKLVLLLDEFDALTRNPSIGPDFYASLRSLSLHQPLALVTASYTDLTQTTAVEAVRTSPFFNIFHTIYLRLLSESAVRQLLNDHLQNTGVSFTATETDQLLTWAGFHPFYLKLAAHSLYETYLHVTGADDVRWEGMQALFHDQVQSHYLRLWRASTDDERLILCALALQAQEEGASRGYSEKTLTDIHHFARRTLRALDRRCLVNPSYDKRYRLFGRSFAVWLLEELQASVSEQQQFGVWLYRMNEDAEAQSVLAQLDEFTLQVLAQIKPVYRMLGATWLAVPVMRDRVWRWWQGAGQQLIGASPLAQPKPTNAVYLRQLMCETLSDGEVRTVCFDVGVDYEGLDGNNKNDKARELLLACQKLGLMVELIEACHHLYPHLNWDG